ncbi:hypothetical protein OH76DRAFT_245345 [Lentinus brumalis]|uniref:Uncharacterized protein n=1 Tax=Lentinus brumalis TaxID=2498619 RepID=A0A371CLU1_9APHY|nr:hypothetical protein OH76DRAFT_245345 [Polyporus brumalis]
MLLPSRLSYGLLWHTTWHTTCTYRPLLQWPTRESLNLRAGNCRLSDLSPCMCKPLRTLCLLSCPGSPLHSPKNDRAREEAQHRRLIESFRYIDLPSPVARRLLGLCLPTHLADARDNQVLPELVPLVRTLQGGTIPTSLSLLPAFFIAPRSTCSPGRGRRGSLLTSSLICRTTSMHDLVA